MRKDNSKAFPQDIGQEENGRGGMDLRDYFAAKAMQGDVSRVGYYQTHEHMLITAKKAYSMADAMMEARELSK